MKKLALTVTGTVLALVATFLILANRHLTQHTKLNKARFELMYNSEILHKIKERCGRFPEKLRARSELEPCAQDPKIDSPKLRDPWGQPYLYLSDGVHFVLRTVGERRLYVDESKTVLHE